MPEDKRASKRERERKAWHPAFAEATMAELADYSDVLEFIPEHPLNTEPLKIDLLIIKKPPGVAIEKNIGAIFKLFNLSNELKKENARKVLDEGLGKLKDKAKIRAYIDILTRANVAMKEEADNMARAKNMSFEEILEKYGYVAEWKLRAKIEMAIALVNDGDSVERAAKMAGIPPEELEGYLQ
jgi:predicted HTH domain antitoxin